MIATPNHWIGIPNIKSGLSENLIQSIISLPESQKDELMQILQQDKLENRKKRGEVDAILEDLRKNYVRIDKNKEILWERWKIIHVDLPEVPGSNFKWFKFDFFAWPRIMNENFEKKPDLEKHSLSVKKIWKILQAINEYMEACGAEYDIDVDYENDILMEDFTCKAGDYLINIADLCGSYRLKGNMARFCCCTDHGSTFCCVSPVYENNTCYDANLILLELPI